MLTGFSYQKPRFDIITSALTRESGINVLMRREDLVNAPIGGNKWWKLKYNLKEAIEQNHKTILTFGGAWSNHIYATAAAARLAGLESIGIIRGDRPTTINAVLSFAEEQGMKLKFVSRDEYRRKDEQDFGSRLREEFGNFFLIPEGGSNSFGLRGCKEWGEIMADDAGDYICLPCGTGTTAAGIISGLKNKKSVIGFSVLKGNFMNDLVSEKLDVEDSASPRKWQIENDYHFGGYAKSTHELEKFIETFYKEFSIPLEPVYTGKMMYGIFDLIKKNFFPRGSTVLAIHTGGIH